MAEKPINPGDLNIRVAWRRRRPNQAQTSGQAVPQWDDMGVFSAGIETLRPFEVYAAAQNKQAVDTQITMRDVGDIRTGDTLTTLGAYPVQYVVKVPTRPNEHRGFVVLKVAAVVSP